MASRRPKLRNALKPTNSSEAPTHSTVGQIKVPKLKNEKLVAPQSSRKGVAGASPLEAAADERILANENVSLNVQNIS